ncbi:MAG: hypothetical protein M3237_03275 [Actinomycetota bacterium]|nr:hypothetical protein [Actinomycetota bacterium]
MLPLLDDLVQAHGVGGQKDLPISLPLAISGAVAALVVSFTVLAVAWRTPRYDAATSGRPAPAWLDRTVRSTAFRVGLRLVGFVLFVYTGIAAVLGQNLFINPVFGLFYVVLWVGVVFASALLGPVWKAISPVRTINLAFAKLSGSDPDRGVYGYPERLGYWPAALGLYAFVWMELVYPFTTELPSVRLWMAVYVAAMLVGGALFGNGFYERADPFEVFSSLIGKLSPWSMRDGHLIVRSPLANLDSVEVRPGLIAVVAVLFGSTGYDSFRESSRWLQYVQGSGLSENVLNNAALLAFCVAVGLVFTLGCMLTGVDPETPRRSLPDRLAHSVVPIILGYFVAHYLTYFFEVSQRTLQYASDPLSEGSDILGTADLQISYWFSNHQTLVANIKVVAVVIGHVLGAMAAHDRSVKLLPPRHQLTGQLPVLFAMITFTAGGLYLLFAG